MNFDQHKTTVLNQTSNCHSCKLPSKVHSSETFRLVLDSFLRYSWPLWLTKQPKWLVSWSPKRIKKACSKEVYLGSNPLSWTTNQLFKQKHVSVYCSDCSVCVLYTYVATTSLPTFVITKKPGWSTACKLDHENRKDVSWTFGRNVKGSNGSLGSCSPLGPLDFDWILLPNGWTKRTKKQIPL